MAKNDRIILDHIFSEAAKARSVANDGAFFEQFALEQLAKDWDLSPDEVAAGMTDGRDDGGIDAWYVLLDGEPLQDDGDIGARRTAATLEIAIFTCKHHDTFRQDPVVHLTASLRELLDLSTEYDTLASRYNEAILGCREILKNALIATARANPQLRIRIGYVSRGDSEVVAPELRARSDAILGIVNSLFSSCTASFDYIGSTELLLATRKLRDFAARLKFQEGPISRGPSNYTGLATLAEYFRFITDSDGNLRRYLFESNVRDYMGYTYVNSSIASTLKTALPSTCEDFWWLNNGVTIIGSRANVIGKELHLENVQIVNGLQTTEAVYAHFARNSEAARDDRCILVKVLITNDKALADRIILATNNQNKVDAASLRATDKIQRDIEDLLGLNGWFYDRRKNHYVNHGKPQNRIVSMSFLSWAILAVRLGEAHKATRTRPKYMQVEREYGRIFDSQANINIFLAALTLCKAVEAAMQQLSLSDEGRPAREYATLFRFLYSHFYVAARLQQRRWTDESVIELASAPIDVATLELVHSVALASKADILSRVPRLRKLHRSCDFEELVLSRLLPSVGTESKRREGGKRISKKGGRGNRRHTTVSQD